MFRHALRSVHQVALMAALVSVPSAAYGQGVPRTSWGHPDLQGTWSTATITPFERPSEFAGKEFLTREEAAEFERRTLECALAAANGQISDAAKMLRISRATFYKKLAKFGLALSEQDSSAV